MQENNLFNTKRDRKTFYISRVFLSYHSKIYQKKYKYLMYIYLFEKTNKQQQQH